MTTLDSPGDGEKIYAAQNYDVEANKPVQSPTTSTFPGTTYGFEPSDQPSQPPRRIPSIHSLKRNRSMTSLQTDPNSTAQPPPPLPPTSQYQPQTPASHQPPTQPDQTSLQDELAWGPSHPCFPHLNPHVPLSSPQYTTTRIIRIRRDWMIAGDLAPTYSNIYPEILDPLISETEFRRIIHHINTTLLGAFDPFSVWNWLDGLLGLLTGWLWEDLRPRAGGVKGKLTRLERWIDMWNERVGAHDGVRLISLRRTGYVGLDIEIPDPQVKVVDENDGVVDGPGAAVEQGDGSVANHALHGR